MQVLRGSWCGCGCSLVVVNVMSGIKGSTRFDLQVARICKCSGPQKNGASSQEIWRKLLPPDLIEGLWLSERMCRSAIQHRYVCPLRHRCLSAVPTDLLLARSIATSKRPQSPFILDAYGEAFRACRMIILPWQGAFRSLVEVLCTSPRCFSSLSQDQLPLLSVILETLKHFRPKGFRNVPGLGTNGADYPQVF